MSLVIIGLTGATGAMGGEILSHLVDSISACKRDSAFEYRIKILVRNAKRRRDRKFFRDVLKRGKNEIEIVDGALEDKESVVNFVKECTYVVHCGAIIPPKSDHDAKKTMAANYGGTKNIVDAIDECGQKDTTKLVYISTVALYGHRNYKHLWARMGDPVMVSAYDYYGASKALAERYVLESDIAHWVVLRQTGILHKYFMANNLNDGLMFHTVWNGVLEWVTDKDSGLMIQHLVEKDLRGELNGFWNNDYNICGGKNCRTTGYDAFKSGFILMGATPEQFFKPNWNIPRNFHGVWYSDSAVLNKWLDYQTETYDDFWARMKKNCWYYTFGRMVPVALLRKIVIERLLTNSNAPARWISDNNIGRINAFWGSREAYEKIPCEWKSYPLLVNGQTEDGPIDYQLLLNGEHDKKNLLDHGYDESKQDSELSLSDMKQAALFRGGSCESKAMKQGDLFTPLTWKCHNGHTFTAKPFTVLKAGFWCPECCQPAPWTYDREVPHIPFYAQVYYDSHDVSEKDRVYPPEETK